jgi:hypothetical protein
MNFMTLSSILKNAPFPESGAVTAKIKPYIVPPAFFLDVVGQFLGSPVIRFDQKSLVLGDQIVDPFEDRRFGLLRQVGSIITIVSYRFIKPPFGCYSPGFGPEQG